MTTFTCNLTGYHPTGEPADAFHITQNTDGTFTIRCYYSAACPFTMHVKKIE